MKKINVAVVGVGSFTKALVEGVSYYTRNPEDTTGLISPTIGGYKVSDINFSCAFDVDQRKVGQKLHKAISMGANVAKEITQPVEYEAVVHRGPTLDGVNEKMRGSFIQESKEPEPDQSKIVDALKKSKTEVVVNLLPTGSKNGTYAYAEAAAAAGCSYVNCIPTPIATVPEIQKKFKDKGLVIIGDDIKSQLGATMLNRLVLEEFKMRGIKVTKSEQENIGGNADHFNLLSRSESKEKSKREALAGFLEEDDSKPKVSFHYTGTPSGHKLVKLKIDGELFGRTPISVNATIEDEISFNGAGTLVDAIRIARVLVEQGRQADAGKASAFLMKSPAVKMSDSEAFAVFNSLRAVKKMI